MPKGLGKTACWVSWGRSRTSVSYEAVRLVRTGGFVAGTGRQDVAQRCGKHRAVRAKGVMAAGRMEGFEAGEMFTISLELGKKVPPGPSIKAEWPISSCVRAGPSTLRRRRLEGWKITPPGVIPITQKGGAWRSLRHPANGKTGRKGQVPG